MHQFVTHVLLHLCAFALFCDGLADGDGTLLLAVDPFTNSLSDQVAIVRLE